MIDGVPYTQELDDDFDFSTANEEDLGALLNIAPTDIESVEVLKDAAATAIWGTKGANGVLSIDRCMVDSIPAFTAPLKRSPFNDVDTTARTTLL